VKTGLVIAGLLVLAGLVYWCMRRPSTTETGTVLKLADGRLVPATTANKFLQRAGL
jgi:hypothetical protein